MEALESARLAAPVEIHDEPTAPIPLHQLEDAIARSIGPRGRTARGSSGHEAFANHEAFADHEALADVDVSLIETPVVRTFPARHPWLVTAAALAVTCLLLLALHGTAGP